MGVALYATVVATTASNASDADGYRAAFLVAAARAAALGLAAALLAHTRTSATSLREQRHADVRLRAR